MKRVVFGIWAVLALWGGAQQIEGMEISGFRVPEYDEQGQMVSQLFGEHAQMGSNQTVRIDGVRVEFYRDGQPFLTATTPYCFYDRAARQVNSDAPVRAEMDGMLLTGKGILLKAGEQTVHVQEQCRVEIADVMQQADLNVESPEDNSQTVITSRELFLNYSGRSARFVGTVHVDDSQLTLDSETLQLRFSENHEIDWIEALTDVRLQQEGRDAYADKATYDVKTDEFVLEGNPRLVDGKNLLLGERIRFWRASKRMVCEPKARLVIYPDQALDSDLFEKE